MKTWFQRIRGAIGIGLTWAAGWAPLGAVTGWITATILGFPLGVVTANYAVTFSLLGFVGGTLFSGVLRLAERHRTFSQLSLQRFVAWGAIGGLLLGGLAVAAGLFGAGVTTLGAAIIAVSTLLGAGSAASTLAVARAAAHQHMISPAEPALEIDLAGENARQRLGPVK